MATLSKVKKVETGSTWDGHGKTFINHTYEMEDGAKFGASHLTEIPFPVGTEVEYEVTQQASAEYGAKGKVSKPKDESYSGGYKSQGGGKSNYVQDSFAEKSIGFAYSYAKDLCCAGIITPKQLKDTAVKIHEDMNEMMEAIKTKPVPVKDTPPPPTEEPPVQEEETDDLPF